MSQPKECSPCTPPQPQTHLDVWVNFWTLYTECYHDLFPNHPVELSPAAMEEFGVRLERQIRSALSETDANKGKFWKSNSCRWPQCGCTVTPRECYVLVDSGSSHDKWQPLSRERIEEFRREYQIPDDGKLEPWAVEENRVLNEVCILALTSLSAPSATVPTIPTEAMIDAGAEAFFVTKNKYPPKGPDMETLLKAVWPAMLSASTDGGGA